MLACIPNEDVDDVSERKAAEGEVAPLVRGLHQSADKACNNHDFVDEDHKEGRWPRHACGQHEVHKEEWCRDEPDRELESHERKSTVA